VSLRLMRKYLLSLTIYHKFCRPVLLAINHKAHRAAYQVRIRMLGFAPSTWIDRTQRRAGLARACNYSAADTTKSTLTKLNESIAVPAGGNSAAAGAIPLDE
jgi:hypothetical protein